MLNEIALLCGFLALPVVTLIVGIILLKNPPAVNGFFGYRTKMSMKNENIWQFAQTLSGSMFVKIFAPLTVVSAAVFFTIESQNEDTKFTVFVAVLAINIAAVAFVNHGVGRVLKREFDEDGNRKADRDEL